MSIVESWKIVLHKDKIDGASKAFEYINNKSLIAELDAYSFDQ